MSKDSFLYTLSEKELFKKFTQLIRQKWKVDEPLFVDDIATEDVFVYQSIDLSFVDNVLSPDNLYNLLEELSDKDRERFSKLLSLRCYYKFIDVITASATSLIKTCLDRYDVSDWMHPRVYCCAMINALAIGFAFPVSYVPLTKNKQGKIVLEQFFVDLLQCADSAIETLKKNDITREKVEKLMKIVVDDTLRRCRIAGTDIVFKVLSMRV